MLLVSKTHLFSELLILSGWKGVLQGTLMGPLSTSGSGPITGVDFDINMRTDRVIN